MEMSIGQVTGRAPVLAFYHLFPVFRGSFSLPLPVYNISLTNFMTEKMAEGKGKNIEVSKEHVQMPRSWDGDVTGFLGLKFEKNLILNLNTNKPYKYILAIANRKTFSGIGVSQILFTMVVLACMTKFLSTLCLFLYYYFWTFHAGRSGLPWLNCKAFPEFVSQPCREAGSITNITQINNRLNTIQAESSMMQFLT